MQVDLPEALLLPDEAPEAFDAPPPVAGGAAAGGAASGHHDGGQGLADTPAAEVAQQIALPEPLDRVVQPLRFAWRSAESVAFARQAQQLKRKSDKLASTTGKLTDATDKLRIVSATIPGAGRLISGSASSSSGQVGRIRQLRPEHFAALSFSVFFPPRIGQFLGIKHKRLVCFGCGMLLSRQSAALQLALDNARRFAAAGGAAARAIAEERRFVGVVYSHEWDEASGMFRLHRQQIAGVRPSAAAAHVETMVQRGAVTFSSEALLQGRRSSWQEEWICAPLVVQGVSAADLLPGLRRGMPAHLQWEKPETLAAAVGPIDMYCFSPIGDRASSNCLLQKYFGSIWESRIGPMTAWRVLYFPESCQVHSHHRAKASLLELRPHVLRHHGMSSLLRLQGVRGRIAASLEQLVAQKCRCSDSRSPAAEGKLHVFLDVLFELDGPHHQRRTGFSVFRQDLQTLLEMLGDSFAPGDELLVHRCRRGASGQLCCDGPEHTTERMTAAIGNVLLGSADLLPSESRWTHTLPSFCRSLLRAALAGVGIEAFRSALLGAPAPPNVDVSVDDTAMADYIVKLNGVRSQRVHSYLSSEGMVPQLVILTLIMSTIDRLLYAMIGGADRAAPAAKVAVLLDRDSSLVGSTLAQLLQMLVSWVAPDPLRRPMCVAEMLKAPLRSVEFADWARRQILLANTAISRRYEQKYGQWPYKLVRIFDEKWNESDRRDIAEELIAARRCCLDSFGFGVRNRFPSVPLLLSPMARACLRSAFEGLRLTTDLSERQNAEMTACRPSRAAGRDFEFYSRLAVVRQARAIHLQRGGADPHRPRDIRSSLAGEQLRICPFLCPPSGPRASASLPCPPPGPAEASPSAVVAASSSSGIDAQGLRISADASRLVPLADDAMCDAVVVDKLGVAPATPREEESAAQPSRRGLNPKLMFINQFLASSKQALGGRSLTKTELADARARAVERWEALPDKGAWVGLFRNRQDERIRNSGRQPESVAGTLYTGIWGGGIRASPCSAQEMFEHHCLRGGWPNDSEVHREKPSNMTPDTEVRFSDHVDYRCFGCLRSASGACRAGLPDKRKFEMIEQGLHNLLTTLPREQVQAGGVFILVEGATQDGRVARELAFVTGVMWTPRSFDVTLCDFGSVADAHAQPLSLPFLCRLRERECAVTDRFTVLASETSGTFVARIADTYVRAMLYLAGYKVAWQPS